MKPQEINGFVLTEDTSTSALYERADVRIRFWYADGFTNYRVSRGEKILETGCCAYAMDIARFTERVKTIHC